MSPCTHGAYPVFEKYFNECLYNARDVAGFAVGMLSIGAWLLAQMPQIISNFRNSSAEALSAWFLGEWLLGDTCNLIGLLLAGDQAATMTYTATYFLCTDMCLILQYIYYGSLKRRRERLRSLRSSRSRPHAHPHHRLQPAPHAQGLPPYRPLQSEASGDAEASGEFGAVAREAVASRAGGAAGGARVSWAPAPPKVRLLACAACCLLLHLRAGGLGSNLGLGLVEPSGGSGPGRVLTARRALLGGGEAGEALAPLRWLGGEHPEWARNAGTAVGWASSALYVGSRVSQIVKTAQRRSAEGLALSMFLAAILANSLYGAGILLRSRSLAQLSGSAPWLLGSLGTVLLDIVIFLQGMHYSRGRRLYATLSGRGFAEPARSPMLDEAP